MFAGLGAALEEGGTGTINTAGDHTFDEGFPVGGGGGAEVARGSLAFGCGGCERVTFVGFAEQEDGLGAVAAADAPRGAGVGLG